MWTEEREPVGGWRKFYIQGLYNFLFSPNNQIRKENMGALHLSYER
jgi:hypothetical protein